MMTLGKQQYETYLHERLETKSKSVMDTIKQHKLSLLADLKHTNLQSKNLKINH